MTVGNIVNLLSDNIKIRLDWNGGCYTYDKNNQLHHAAFDNFVVAQLIPDDDMIDLVIAVTPLKG